MYTVTKGVRDSRDRVRVLTLYRVDPKTKDFLTIEKDLDTIEKRPVLLVFVSAIRNQPN